jgi:hypothetical protein
MHDLWRAQLCGITCASVRRELLNNSTTWRYNHLCIVWLAVLVATVTFDPFAKLSANSGARVVYEISINVAVPCCAVE